MVRRSRHSRKPRNWDGGKLPRGVERHGDGFRAWVSVGSGKKEKSKVFPTIDKAKDVAIEWRRQLRSLPDDPATLGDGMDLIRVDCRAEKAEGTLASYEGHFLSLVKTWPAETLLLEIDEKAVRAFKRKRLHEVKPSVVHHQMSLGRRVFNLAIEEGVYDGCNPFAKVGMPKMAATKRNVFGFEEVQWIVRTIRDWNHRGNTSRSPKYQRRDAAIVAFLALTGLRRTELTRVRVCDVNLKTGTICVPKSKTGGARYRPIPPAFVDVLHPFVEKRTSHAQLFPLKPNAVSDLFRRWRSRLAKAGLQDPDRFTPHAFRHSWATEYWKQTRDPEALRQAGGWKLMKTVQNYMHVDNDQDREAVLSLRMLPPDVEQQDGGDAQRQAAPAS